MMMEATGTPVNSSTAHQGPMSDETLIEDIGDDGHCIEAGYGFKRLRTSVMGSVLSHINSLSISKVRALKSIVVLDFFP